MFPESLKNLIESLKLFPGIGEKTAERMAFSVLDFENEMVEVFSESLLQVKDKIHKCSCCNTLTENDICFVCADKSRDRAVLCVVEDTKNVFYIERLGAYNGMYHVLGGLISPLDGINPEDIGIDKLLERINSDKFNEVILAFKPSIEGETTSLYIKKILSDLDIVISRLASGVPIGADMEYVDSLTLERAIKDRKTIE